MAQPVVFLDRDGTINIDRGYVFKRKDFELIAGVGEALARLAQLGYAFVIVTNQGGIARGLYTERDVDDVHAYLRSLMKPYGVNFLNIVHCPHHPLGVIEELKVPCTCRKPATGLFEKAISGVDVAWEASFMVGDKETDILAGRAMGLAGVRVGFPKIEKRDDGVLYVPGLPDFVAWLEGLPSGS